MCASFEVNVIEEGESSDDEDVVPTPFVVFCVRRRESDRGEEGKAEKKRNNKEGAEDGEGEKEQRREEERGR